MTEWQSIETAPRDGTRILVTGNLWNYSKCIREYIPVTVYWYDGAWETSYPQKRHAGEPSHWMPLPPPPKKSNE